MSNKVIQDMPVMLKHEGIWQGVYTHVDIQGNVIDQHDSKVICEFPETGASAYTQHNHFTWADGATKQVSFPESNRVTEFGGIPKPSLVMVGSRVRIP